MRNCILKARQCPNSTQLEEDRSSTPTESASSPIIRTIGGFVANILSIYPGDCSVFGCHKKLCWAYCGLSYTSGEWCYTTRGVQSQNGEYVSCNMDSECNGCWKCAGPCAIF
ncbi:Allergen Tha p 2 [Folsomia candida]|uniref:Allergen Tha p 2 n=2 Tax=Folsomia candida TaxID=158441 RepID=A0A226DT60_FOLCA|nr:Allergen Tha p 2 [Folsomia candida]